MRHIPAPLFPASLLLLASSLCLPLSSWGQVTPVTTQSVTEAGLSLVQAEKLWQEHNRELRLARGAVSAAEADRVAAGQAPNPQFTFSTTSLNPRTGIGGGSLRDKTMDSVLRLDQLLERGDKRALREQVAGARLEAAQRDLDDTGRQSRFQFQSAYWDLRLAQEKVQVAEESAELYRRSQKAADLRLKVGDIAVADAARLRVEVARAENDARAAKSDLAAARVALAYFIGQESAAASLAAADPWPDLGSVPVPVAEGGLEARPDVQAALARVKAAEAARELARANRSRDVSVGVQFEHYPPGNESPNNTYGVSVSIPLFLRHSYEGEIARAEADLQVARELLDQTRALARGEVDRVAAALQAAADRRQRLESGLLADAERVAKAAEFAYSKGASSLLDLLDARRTLRAVRFDAAALRAEHAKTLAAWQATQGK